MKAIKIYLHFFILFLASTKSINEDKKATIHFIKVGSADSILIESDGHFGMIDTANNYLGEIDEVQKVVIDESKGEKNQGTDDPNISVVSVINYLEHLGIKKLEFILSTHAHNDHLGGIPAVAYKFVDENTKYYYRSYRETSEDTYIIEWANHAYYTAAFQSMVLKKAQVYDITEKTIDFDFGNIHIKFFNTDIDPDELNLGENDNTIVTLVTYKDKKILLTGDLTAHDDVKMKDTVEKIDVLKLAHHGYSETSYEFLKVALPDYIVVSNSWLPEHGEMVVSFLQQILKRKVYITANVADSTVDVANSAIRLSLFDETEDTAKYSFENTGDEIEVPKVTRWHSWYGHKVYLKDGIIAKSWNEIEWEESLKWFYFDEEGLMLVKWQKLIRDGEEHTYYFQDEDGYMLTGFQTLEWTGGVNTFYFMPESGIMVQNTCIEIDGKKYCFDENGCLIEQ